MRGNHEDEKGIEVTYVEVKKDKDDKDVQHIEIVIDEKRIEAKENQNEDSTSMEHKHQVRFVIICRNVLDIDNKIADKVSVQEDYQNIYDIFLEVVEPANFTNSIR